MGAGLPHPKAGMGAAWCTGCGGRLIYSVVNFGDSLPEKELPLSAEHARQCDLMLVLGSSLVVNPAAALVGLALKSGARVVLVNQGKTPYDEAVTLRSWEGISEVIPPARGAVEVGASSAAAERVLITSEGIATE